MAYALATTVNLEGRSAEEGGQLLETQVLPIVKGLAGFQRGLWLRATDGSKGLGIILFDSEEHATAARDGLQSNRPADAPPITGTDVYSVVTEA